jgi:glycosyltransferase involved in cell wall biosynthesis
MSDRLIIALDIERTFGNASPSLVAISNPGLLPPIDVAEICVAKKWPFVTLANLNSPYEWPTDEMAARFRKVLPLARRCFFVSDANRALAERQLGYDFDNAEIVCNPLLVDKNLHFRWPDHGIDHELRMACVATLNIAHKGQDILLDVLASPYWRDRKWRLTFYGRGLNRDLLERLVERLKLRDRVNFAGRVAVEAIWRENHVLIMPSRFEGGPMTTMEAMWCGRPVVATNVGLNPEVIKDGVTGFLAETAGVEALSGALERMWVQRHNLENIGKLAAASIRDFLPDDPVALFAEKLKGLAAISYSEGASYAGGTEDHIAVRSCWKA